jgi:hypothetical protein
MLHFSPLGQAGQVPPPQSVSVSFPSFIPSEQPPAPELLLLDALDDDVVDDDVVDDDVLDDDVPAAVLLVVVLLLALEPPLPA